MWEIFFIRRLRKSASRPPPTPPPSGEEGGEEKAKIQSSFPRRKEEEEERAFPISREKQKGGGGEVNCRFRKTETKGKGNLVAFECRRLRLSPSSLCQSKLQFSPPRRRRFCVEGEELRSPPPFQNRATNFDPSLSVVHCG